MTDYTKYFSWGDVIGKNKNGTGSYSFSTANYNAGVCGKGYTLTQNITQGNTTYDAATANMGYPWKMPTKEQSQELIDDTNHSWGTLNGVNGTKIFKKTDDSKFIFLPWTGKYDQTYYDFAGRNGYCWTTVITSGLSAPYFLVYSDGDPVVNATLAYPRSIGMTVRAIQ